MAIFRPMIANMSVIVVPKPDKRIQAIYRSPGMLERAPIEFTAIFVMLNYLR